MPRRRPARLRPRGKQTVTPALRMLLGENKLTGPANTSTVPLDLINRPQNFNIVQRPPKQIGNQIYWFKERYESSMSTSTSTYAESNWEFSLSLLNSASAVAGLFDQYCIYAVAVNFSIDTGTSNPQLCIVDLLTAVDYDSVASIGPSGIQQYNTNSAAQLTTSTSHTRVCEPCVATALYNGAFSAYGIARLWIDSQSTSVQHYGIRSIALQSPNVIKIRVSMEYVVGCRNKY